MQRHIYSTHYGQELADKGRKICEMVMGCLSKGPSKDDVIFFYAKTHSHDLSLMYRINKLPINSCFAISLPPLSKTLKGYPKEHLIL